MRDKTGVPPFIDRIVIDKASVRPSSASQRMPLYDASGNYLGFFGVHGGFPKLYLVDDKRGYIRIGGTGEFWVVYESAQLATFAETVIDFFVPFDMNSQKITAMADPTANQDAATKKYVDDNVRFREYWSPCTVASSGAVMSYDSNTALYPGALCAGLNQRGHMSLRIPSDFVTLTAAYVVVIPETTQASANYDVYVAYSAIGEDSATHTASDTTTTYNATIYKPLNVPVTTLLSSIVADDHLSVALKEGTAGHDVLVLGLYIKYQVD